MSWFVVTMQGGVLYYDVHTQNSMGGVVIGVCRFSRD